MSIEIRELKNTKFLTETRRVGGKIIKTHIGKLDEVHVEFLHRKSQLQSAMRKQLREECKRARSASDQIAGWMSLLIDFFERRDTVVRLVDTHKWKRKAMNKDKQSNLDADGVRKAVDSLPTRLEFEELCRSAELGDPQSIETFERLVEQTPELLDSVADLIELAKALVIQDVSANSPLMQLGIEQKLSNLVKSLGESDETDAINLMNSEVLVTSYLDAMRCGLLAFRMYDTHSDAEHFQKLADRSQRRYERAQAAYSRYLKQLKRAQ